MTVFYSKNTNKIKRNSIAIINNNDIDISYSIDNPQYNPGKKTICIVKKKNKVEVSYADEYAINLLFYEINNINIAATYRNLYRATGYTSVLQIFMELFINDFKDILIEYHKLDIKDINFDNRVNVLIYKTNMRLGLN